MSDRALTERSCRTALEAGYSVRASLTYQRNQATRFVTEDTAKAAGLVYAADGILPTTIYGKERWLVSFGTEGREQFLRFELLREWKTQGEDTPQ